MQACLIQTRNTQEQRRTRVLFEKTLKMLTLTLKLAALPLLQPLHRLAGDLLAVVYGD